MIPRRIELVPSCAVYADLFCQWRSDPAAQRFNPFASTTLVQAAARLAEAGLELAEYAARHLALDDGGAIPRECRRFVRADGVIVGNVALTRFNGSMLTAEIAYQMGAEHQGRGLGTAAVRLFVDEVFSETPLRRLTALVHEQNLASRRLLERVGFRCEGLLREHFLIGGQPANEVVYGLLRGEATAH